MCPGRLIVRTSALRSYIYLHREWKRPIYHADFQERAVSGIHGTWARPWPAQEHAKEQALI